MRTAVWRAVAAVGVAVASITFGPDPELLGGDEASRPPSTTVPVRVWPAVESDAVVASIVSTTSTTSLPPPRREPRTVAAGSDEAVWAHLARIRACESGGDYGAVSRSGTYSGAYQWSASTWRWSSEGAGHPGYARPTDAPPPVQDAVAYWLYTNSNPYQQWPNCSRR
jgi:hypothetical protein